MGQHTVVLTLGDVISGIRNILPEGNWVCYFYQQILEAFGYVCVTSPGTSAFQVEVLLFNGTFVFTGADLGAGGLIITALKPILFLYIASA